MSPPRSRAEVLVVVGTRPEAIKQAPVVRALRSRPGVAVRVLCTGQHPDLLAGLLELLDLGDAEHLPPVDRGLPLTTVLAATVEAIGTDLRRRRPSVVVVQGDTTAALAGALAGFHEHVPVAHVEAGLRTGDPRRPFPEEANRRMVSTLAALHLAPTEGARRNLLAEGVDPDRVLVTGNPVVDALQHLRAGAQPPRAGRPRVVVTVHRRESWGPTLHGIAGALADIALAHPGVDLVVPAHPNPLVRGPLLQALAGVANAEVVDPLPYDAFLRLLAGSALVLTDSGGIQEEAPSFGVPVLLLRQETERPEGVEAGLVRLVGTDREAIVAAATAALARGRGAPSEANPYGDGGAGPRIADAICARLLDGDPAAGAQTVPAAGGA